MTETVGKGKKKDKGAPGVIQKAGLTHMGYLGTGGFGFVAESALGAPARVQGFKLAGAGNGVTCVGWAILSVPVFFLKSV